MHDVARLQLLNRNEMHQIPYAGHPHYQGMIIASGIQICWPGMEVELINYLSNGLGCQKVKTKHLYLAGLL